jgi:BMFP domain-containing protein YqiC
MAIPPLWKVTICSPQHPCHGVQHRICADMVHFVRQSRAKRRTMPPDCASGRADRRRSGLIDWLAARTASEMPMEKTAFLDDLQDKLEALFANTPAADLQRNMKALLMQQFARLDLVTREEFDTQVKVLARTRERLEALEARLREIGSNAP